MEHLRNLVMTLREEKTTMDEDGEKEVSKPRELSEASNTPHDKVMKVKGKMPRVGQACVPKQAEFIISAEARMVPCNQC